jgi:hypothetical protein
MSLQKILSIITCVYPSPHIGAARGSLLYEVNSGNRHFNELHTASPIEEAIREACIAPQAKWTRFDRS